MEKHTEGPWKIRSDDSQGETETWVESDASVRVILDFTPMSLDDEGQANLALVAAAPDLLEALKAMLRASGDLADESRLWHYDGDRLIENYRKKCPMCLARAAIAKAETLPFARLESRSEREAEHGDYLRKERSEEREHYDATTREDAAYYAAREKDEG